MVTAQRDEVRVLSPKESRCAAYGGDRPVEDATSCTIPSHRRRALGWSRQVGPVEFLAETHFVRCRLHKLTALTRPCSEAATQGLQNTPSTPHGQEQRPRKPFGVPSSRTWLVRVPSTAAVPVVPSTVIRRTWPAVSTAPRSNDPGSAGFRTCSCSAPRLFALPGRQQRRSHAGHTLTELRQQHATLFGESFPPGTAGGVFGCEMVPRPERHLPR